MARPVSGFGQHKGLSPDYIKCMALVEAHPLAYQMEEFLFNLREHCLGLNLGRGWDYMAAIDFMSEDPNGILPDRNTICTPCGVLPELPHTDAGRFANNTGSRDWRDDCALSQPDGRGIERARTEGSQGG